LNDGNIIECAVFERSVDKKKEEHACISTQVGCKYNCVFCTSGKNGFKRNLSADEILEQLHLLAKSREINKFDRINLMGIGEPLDNYTEVVKVLNHLFRTKDHYNEARPLAIATNGGLPEELIDLAQLTLPVEVWFSLHSVDDEKRNRLMPINRRFNVQSVINLAKQYVGIAQRPVWLNYMIFSGFNNTSKDVDEISKLLMNTENIFRLVLTEPNNDVQGLRRADYKDLVDFESKLRTAGVNNPIIRFVTAGKNIGAGCGEFMFIPERESTTR
jgi:23S rRNA (adenine2503-C2)-methyltransferase